MQGTISTLIMSLVITYMKSIKDVKVLMMLSTFWHKYFFSNAEIMKKVLINIKGFTDTTCATKFIKRFGKYFVNVKIELSIELDQFLVRLLKRAKNLKELTIDDFLDTNEQVTHNNKINRKLPRMNKLNILKVRSFSRLKSLISCTAKVDSLKELVIEFWNLDCHFILSCFIKKQKNLKSLKIKFHSSLWIDIFPIDPKFKLDKLSIRIENIKLGNFLNFLKTQKELKQLEMDGNFDEKTTTNILNMFDSLEKFTIGKHIKDIFQVKKENLQHFEDKRCTSNAAEINAAYPNLKFLNVQSINASEIESFSLTKLKIGFGRFWELKNMHFECLQEITFSKLPRLESSFNEFINNILNIKVFRIESLTSLNDFVHVMDKLRSLKSLKIFNLQHGKVQMFCEDKKFYKIEIDVNSQRIRLSRFILENYVEIYKLLQICYPQFKFIEICYEESDLYSRRLNSYYLENKYVKIIPSENGTENELVKLLRNPFDINSTTQTILVTFGGCLKELYIRDIPFDNVGENALKYMIEEMKLETFCYGKVPLILNGEKQKLTELTLSGIQISSIYEMFRQFPSKFLSFFNNF